MEIQAFRVSESIFIDDSMSRKLFNLQSKLPRGLEIHIVNYKDKKSTKMRIIILLRCSKKNLVKIGIMYLKNTMNVERIFDRKIINKILSYAKQ